jgi:hypothetical protein
MTASCGLSRQTECEPFHDGPIDERARTVVDMESNKNLK